MTGWMIGGPIQWVPGAVSLGVEQLGHEIDHSPPSSSEVKYEWSYTSTHNMPPWCGAHLRKSTGITLPLLLS
jgi:hypothetical protein